MKTYRDEAVVLRTYNLGEADRILVLLTHSNGQVRAVAKGVRRTASRFGGRLEPFNHVALQLYRGRNLHTVTQAESVHAFGAVLAADYDKYTRASVMVEVAERLTGEDDMSTQQYLLLIGALHALARGKLPAQFVVDSYLLRALALGGWAPSFYDCAVCGTAGPQPYFAIPAGGAVCQVCRPAGASQPPPDALRLLGALLSGDWHEAASIDQAAAASASGLVAAYVQYTMERRLRSLSFIPVNER
ncbi:MAG: DNA repair protein RecO [Bowdeniella nasicola]|nr:DNA repair protein RecO [Bowdeniella nasicola]